MTDYQALPPAETQEDDVYSVYSLCYGKVPERRVHQNFLKRDMHDGPMPLDFNVWLITNAHRTVLVDTGFSEAAAHERGYSIDINPVDALSKIGVPPEGMTDVVITHLHFDHAGNLDRFPNSRFHIQDAEVNFATGRCMCDAHHRRPFNVEDVVTLVRQTYADKVTFHAGNADLYPGISLHVLPGHTPGLQAVRVKTSRGPILLASDASHTYANFSARSPYPHIVDIADTLESYEEMLRLGGSAEHIIPGHDPRVRDFYPSIFVNGIELHALHEAPLAHDTQTLSKVCEAQTCAAIPS